MILLTGATGFIGGYLIDRLVRDYGAENILALTSKPTNICPYILHDNYNFNDTVFSGEEFESVDTIIHAGAFTPKTSASGNDISKCNSNIINTNSLLSLNFPNLKKFIFLSTLDVYAHQIPITEESAIKPLSLYGSSKYYCENMIDVWGKQNNIDIQILRIGHVFGPGEERYQKMIPVTMKRILSGESVTLYGEGKDIRSFIFISDVIEAIVKSIDLKTSTGIINIVGSEQITIKELLEQIIIISKREVRVEYGSANKIQRDLIFDNIKMCTLLCKPKISLREGLLIEWDYLQSRN